MKNGKFKILGSVFSFLTLFATVSLLDSNSYLLFGEVECPKHLKEVK